MRVHHSFFVFLYFSIQLSGAVYGKMVRAIKEDNHESSKV